MFKQFVLCALVLSLAFFGVGCATPTPVPKPPPTATPMPSLTATLLPPTRTPIPPTATATFTATPLPTVTPTFTAVPTRVLFRRYYTGSFIAYPQPEWTEGCGTLTFENHLDLDLVVVLVRYSTTQPKIHAGIFILARQLFRLLGLGSDNFLGEVYVAAGEDWDPDLAKFTRKNQYFRVPDRLMFFASPSCSHHVVKVVAGAPDLQPIPENQFPRLR